MYYTQIRWQWGCVVEREVTVPILIFSAVTSRMSLHRTRDTIPHMNLRDGARKASKHTSSTAITNPNLSIEAADSASAATVTFERWRLEGLPLQLRRSKRRNLNCLVSKCVLLHYMLSYLRLMSAPYEQKSLYLDVYLGVSY